jgi:hypothetical protein
MDKENLLLRVEDMGSDSYLKLGEISMPFSPSFASHSFVVPQSSFLG